MQFPMSDDTTILLCRCAHHKVLPDRAASEIAERLRTRAVAFTEVDDLCGMAAGSEASLAGRLGTSGPFTIVACHPRAIRWMMHAAGVQDVESRLQVLDMRAMTREAILDRLPKAGSKAALPVSASEPAGDPWLPWFPVIDHQRCIQCRQCVSFCLFGVYELSPEGKAHVANPRNCKNNCPACARICPEAAIMFPKLGDEESPLNGDEIANESALKTRARINVHELLGDDIYAALAERRRRAGTRRLLRPVREQAEQERAACAAKAALHGEAAGGATEPASPAMGL